MNSNRKEQKHILFYIVMALLIGLSPLLSVAGSLLVPRVVAAQDECDNLLIQLALILDGSISISDGDFDTMLHGIADAIEGGTHTQEESPSSTSGNWDSPTNAYSNNNSNAQDDPGDVQQYCGYGFSIPSDATIDGIVVGLEDAHYINLPGSDTGAIAVELSWNGGTTWTSTGNQQVLTSSEVDYFLGGSSNLWGHAWTVSEINSNLCVRLTAPVTNNRAVELDWLPVTIYFSLPPCVPHDGTMELTVIQVGLVGSTGAALEVGPVILTADNYNSVATDIRNIDKRGGYTPLACALYLAADTLFASPCYDPDIKQAINLVTDGIPNRCCPPAAGGSNYNADNCGGCDVDGCSAARTSTENARDYAISTLGMTTNQDEIDAEFIGSQGTASNWLRDYIVYPQPGYYAPPFSGPGWVRVISGAQDYADSICEKIANLFFPVLTIEKLWTDLNAGSVRPSDNICYTINYSNTGTAQADNVVITDDPDETWIDSVYNISDSGSYNGNIITWLIGTLGIGESGSVSYCIQLSDNTTFPAGQTNVTNTVCIEPTDPNVCASVTIEVRHVPNLCLDKTWNDVNGLPPEPGDVICYNIGYCSPVLVHNVVITDDPDETWVDSVHDISDSGSYNGDIITWNIGDFGPGIDNVTYCVTLKGAGTFPAGTTDVDNTACDDADEAELLCDTETVPVEASPFLSLEKIYSDENGGNILPSDNICYSITYTNNGNADAENVVITDDPDETWVGSVDYISDGGSYAGGIITWNIGTVGVGEIDSVSYCVTLKGIGEFPAGDTEVRNTACIQPTEPEVCTTELIRVQAHPTFEVDKQADTETALPGGTVNYTITVCNEGNAAGDNVTITDDPDENYVASVFNISDGGTYDGDTITWNIGTLDPQECFDVTYSATLTGSFPVGTTPVVNTACVEEACDTVTVEVEVRETTTQIIPPPSQRSSPSVTGTNSPAQFCAKFTRCKPRTYPGQPVVVSTNVVNDGDEEGTYNVVLKINGEVEQQKMVTVGPRMASPVNFTVVKSEPGTYNVSIDNEQTSFIVVPNEASRNGGPIIAIVSFIVMLLVVMVLLLIRRRLEIS
ncbi:MAG: hypothetical protein A2Z75_08970 [Chloroflexi bacterium RBG_13_50_10]|nr:MAG: hypothetical protein A2Z75_08970 [Chloroflexi bacterium RBG_13_50_10]